ncbi:hypothetical protein RF11_16029 [Thelohanellus kitauei]|uniref:Tc1-like transposase DDE domain-containing protein n=1 Tax=Thelohanellus kitauei TaxID=669202 RepID=A0A0C2MY69_THEKT|nr:hypothetical protein RF11_16029 [Thelohanellus kitauei]
MAFTGEVFDILNAHFHQREIHADYCKHYSDVIDWPQYAPDLNSCDYLLCVNIKDKTYATNPKSLIELISEIEIPISVLSTEILEQVMDRRKLSAWLSADLEASVIQCLD